jgi:hypothetical protein
MGAEEKKKKKKRLDEHASSSKGDVVCVWGGNHRTLYPAQDGTHSLGAALAGHIYMEDLGEMGEGNALSSKRKTHTLLDILWCDDKQTECKNSAVLSRR